MNIYKRQAVQKLIIDQAGSERLILNDLIFGRDGAEVVSQLLPQYHTALLHIQIKGNNIDAEGFQMILISLMHCPGLVSIQAEWNNIGSSPVGLMALLNLVRNLRFLEMVDLKNNKISHQSAELLADIIKTNNRSLQMLDLRWNDIGQVGAQIIYPALAFNSALKFVGLEDNRISSATLLQINDFLKNTSRGTLNLTGNNNNQTGTSISQLPNIFPITDQYYPSMDAQVKMSQMRAKIQNQQQEAAIHTQKLQLQIEKIMQRMRVKGAQLHQASIQYDILRTQNVNSINHLREAQVLLSSAKEKFFGIDKNLNGQKSAIRAEKYNINLKMQTMMEKRVQVHQRQMEDLNVVMADKYQRLQAYFKDRLNDKRQNREKITQIKEDIIKFKLSKEAIWDKVSLSSIVAQKNAREDEYIVLEDLIGKAEASVRTERKKGEYLADQLTNLVMRGLKREQKFEKEIYEIQNRIKQLHKQMTLANVQIEQNSCSLALKQAQTIQQEANVDLCRRYIKYIQSQNSVNLDIERLKIDQNAKAHRLADDTLEIRITDLERAIKQQQAQNKMIQNHYEKILVQLEAQSKNAIQAVLFG